MGKSSRDKGARGEREASKWLTEHTGIEWRRGIAQTRRGGSESPDVEPVDEGWWSGLHVEIKRRASRVDVAAAMRQACEDAKARDCMPVVLWRVDRQRWQVSVRLGDLEEIVPLARHAPPCWCGWERPWDALVTMNGEDWCRWMQDVMP